MKSENFISFIITCMSTNFKFYETIQIIENIEIRKYDEQIIASHDSKDNSNNNFQF